MKGRSPLYKSPSSWILGETSSSVLVIKREGTRYRLVLLSVESCQTLSPFLKLGGLTLVLRWYVGSTLMETELEHWDDDAKVEAKRVQCLREHTTLLP